MLQLNDGWQFAQANNPDQSKDSESTSLWYDAEVPGSVQRDLIRHGVLPDPYYGTNEKLIQWVEDKDWDFRKTFMVTAEQLQYNGAEIFFEGLDTHADIFLNGSRILRTENMFVGHKIPVKDLLREGENKLYIRFYSPIQRMMPARETFGYEYPAGNDHREEKLSVYNRKAPYHFGWDWGIRIVQMGIWKPVSIKFYNDARIEDYYVKQNNITKEVAEIDNQIEVYSLVDTPATISVGYTLKGKGKKIESSEKQIMLKKGKNIISLPQNIENPYLWMPVNWGEQHLYDFYAMLTILK